MGRKSLIRSNCCKSSALRTAVCELRARVMDVTGCDVYSTRTRYLLFHPQAATGNLSRVDDSSISSNVSVSLPYVQQHQIEEMRFATKGSSGSPQASCRSLTAFACQRTKLNVETARARYFCFGFSSIICFVLKCAQSIRRCPNGLV